MTDDLHPVDPQGTDNGDPVVLPCTPPPCPPFRETTLRGTPIITAAGGWCAPSETLYDLEPLRARTNAVLYGTEFPRVELPEVSAHRRGVAFDLDHSQGAVIAAAEALRSQVHRAAIEAHKHREETIRQAVAIAYANGWDVHLHPHHETGWRTVLDVNQVRVINRLGIEFRPAAYGIPTIVEHDPYDATYDWDDD